VSIDLRIAANYVGLAAVSVGAAVVLTGCAGPPADTDQSLTVSYLTAGEKTDVTVDLPQVECSDLGGTLLYTADGENGDEDWGLLTASGNTELDSHTISIGLGDGLWFISTGTFENAEGSLTLNSIEGLVAPVSFDDRSSDVGDSIDTAATATGSVECTS
jgi:hypothetical protein